MGGINGGMGRRLFLGGAGTLVLAGCASQAHAEPAATLKQGTGTDWLNVVTGYGADQTGSSDSTTAIQNALNAAISAGGGVVYLPAGQYKTSSTITGNVNNTTVSITGDTVWATRINYYGTGDCLRLYDSSAYSTRTNHGTGISALTIDGSNTGTSAASAGLHAGDILQFSCNIAVQNFSRAAGSIGIHFDTNYYWTEQLTGQIYAQNCGTNVMFDNSANTSGQATGSFERLLLDVFVDSNGLGDGVTFTNGAFTTDHRLGIYGNFSTSTQQYAVLRLTGSNSSGYSGLAQGVLTIGVELDDTTHTPPYTIYFGSTSGYNYVTKCTGYLDFSAYKTFTPSNNAGQFLFSGPVLGDPRLYSMPGLGSPEFTETILANGQLLYTQWLPVLRVQTGGTSYTGLVLAAGGYAGQQVTVINEDTGALTFAASSGSNVADGTSDVIPAHTARTFIWDAGTSLWYRMG
jgi:Pectate lyase superfamily protein